MRFAGFILTLAVTFFATTAQAQTYQNIFIKITNTSNAIAFTPIIAATHGNPQDMFGLGTTASNGVEIMAELGGIDTMVIDMTAKNAWVIQMEDPSPSRMLAPGDSLTAALVVGPGLEYISLAGMLYPTNDGFVGLDSFKVPANTGGPITVPLLAYDAGTEENSELIGCGPPFPGAPIDDPAIPNVNDPTMGICGTGAQDPGGESNKIHIHPGNIGDTQANGGISDADSRRHRFLNPVGELTITY